MSMIIVLTGKNEFALKAALDERVGEVEADVGDMGVERIDAAETAVDDVLQAVQSLPFLVPRKLVVISSVQSNTELMERISDVIDRTANEVTVILVGPVFDKRKSAWNTLKKHADEVHEFNELKPFELPQWVSQTAGIMGLKISAQDASYLVERIGPNQMMLSSELKKLSLNTDTVTREMIDRLTEQSVQSTIFDMLDAAFRGRSDQAVELYRQQRKKRVDPQYVIAMLSWQLHGLALAVFAKPATEKTLVEAGQSPYAARKALNLAKRIDQSRVRRLISDLVDVDVNIKTSAEADSALELYLLKLSIS